MAAILSLKNPLNPKRMLLGSVDGVGYCNVVLVDLSLYLHIRWLLILLSGIGHLGGFVCLLASVHIYLLLEGMKVYRISRVEMCTFGTTSLNNIVKHL